MKTLHLTNYWHGTSGGIARFYSALLDAANRHEQEMRLVVPGSETRVERVGKFGKIYHLAAPHAPLNSRYRVLYPAQFLRAGSPLQRILADERPDLVEICDKYSLNYLGTLLRLGLLKDLDFRPVVVAQSCERMDDNVKSYVTSAWLGRAFSSFYMRWLYFPFFDHHIANSTYTAGELVPASKGHPVQRGVWVRTPGVDVERFSPALRSESARQKLLELTAARPDTVVLLYVGRMVPEKNLPLLIDVAAKLAADSSIYRMLIAGEGMALEELRVLARRLAPKTVTFLGHVGDREQLASLYAHCDVFVHPNPREPFGIAPLEAMASGLPLVAPNAGGVLSYANSANAWLADPTPEAFAAAIQQAATASIEKQEKLRAALATAESFRWENVTDSLLDLYKNLCSAAKGCPLEEPPAFFSSYGSTAGGKAVRVVSEAAKRLFGAAARRNFVPPPPEPTHESR
jgi:alpha-1,6-mannosyltransferase